MPSPDYFLARIEHPAPALRLNALSALLTEFKSGRYPLPQPGIFVNNHIHTFYSFSPYSPTAAAFMAWYNGLTTAGIVDHDSLAGAEEFAEACRLLGIASTIGFECRCRMDDTPFAGRRINNPDQNTVAYLVCHGVPRQSIAAAQGWLAPYREARNVRNRAMLANINRLLDGSDLSLDFERDVLPLSHHAEGGGVTERHLLYALALSIEKAFGKGQLSVDFLASQLNLHPEGAVLESLLNSQNPGWTYSLLGALKGGFVSQFYIDAHDECPPIADFIAFTLSLGAVPAYAYLGDVGQSVTGDKKAQTFEDAFLDNLVPWLAQSGCLALTYMPTRNTPQQLERIMALCAANGLFQISGEDINSPAQSFICPALEKAEFAHLVTATWALIGHEKAAASDISAGMFSSDTLAKMPSLPQRIEHFAALGRQTL